MPWLIAILGTVAYYLLFVGTLDRRQDSPWVARDNYRLISMAMVFIALLATIKAVMLWAELRTLIPYCH